jgi:hypothetical protein
MALQLFSHHRQWCCNYFPIIGNGAAINFTIIGNGAAIIFSSEAMALQLFSIIGNGATIIFHHRQWRCN